MSPSRARRGVQPHLVPLGAGLRRAREAVRPQLSGNALAKQLGWSQDRVSRIEAGRQTPTVEDVVAWAGATDADPDHLLDMREAALVRLLDIRAAARRPGGADALQGDLEALEVGSSTITEYQPTVVPGLAQIPAYTRAWLSQPARVELGDPPDLDDIVRRRASRQRSAVGRRVVVIVPPWVLTAVYGSVQVQRAQLDALITAVSGGALELIIPRWPLALLHGFELLDDAAIVETVAGGHVMADPEVVAQFRAAVTHLRRGSATGPKAIKAVQSARDSLSR